MGLPSLFLSPNKTKYRKFLYTRFYIMSAHFSELKKIISSINDRIDAMCTKTCEEYGLDKDEVLKKIEGCRNGKGSNKETDKEETDKEFDKKSVDDENKEEKNDDVTATTDNETAIDVEKKSENDDETDTEKDLEKDTEKDTEKKSKDDNDSNDGWADFFSISKKKTTKKTVKDEDDEDDEDDEEADETEDSETVDVEEIENDENDSDVDESSCISLYDRARTIFESVYGINESVDGYNFDDYVVESKIDNGILTKERNIDESAVYYGGSMIAESFGRDDEEFSRLLDIVTQGRDELKLSDLKRSDSDTDEVRRAKRRILQLIMSGDVSDINGLNAKEAKKALELSTGPSGRLTDVQLWHKGLDDTGAAIENGLANYFVPQEVTRKLDIPKNLGKAVGTGLSALAFGPVGAIAGTALANWLANNHEKYKAKQYSKLHGGVPVNVGDKMSRYTGSLVGAGLCSLIGGPAGGIIGAVLGHLGQKGYEFLKSKLTGKKPVETVSAKE